MLEELEKLFPIFQMYTIVFYLFRAKDPAQSHFPYKKMTDYAQLLVKIEVFLLDPQSS